MATSGMAPKMRLLGVLVTFHRRETLEATLDRLAAQTRRLDRVVVVDNGSDQGVAELVGREDLLDWVDYMDAGANLGPAGGYELGMAQLLETARDDDWILLLDDDDPPFFDDAFECIEQFASSMMRQDSKTAAVGISGGRFDRSKGLVIRIGDDLIHDAVRVDHITGGGLPCYRVGAIRQVGRPMSELFFGFEELEYGLRFADAGFHLYADGEQWRKRKQVKRDAGLLPPEHVSVDRSSKTNVKVSVASWRRYYSLRNLILILRKKDLAWTAFKVSVARGVVKPLLNIVLNPRDAWSVLKLSLLATRDGWMGITGQTVNPE